MDKFVITPADVCADLIHVEVKDAILHHVQFEGGCDGNGKALGCLLQGMPIADAIIRLRGVTCDDKGTSCADQLAQGLSRYIANTQQGRYNEA